jgi:hypothetical protein|tara:strand:+ start:465 stop:683 length:219 start_codon:yes stop_codon:yes gene_type:complete
MNTEKEIEEVSKFIQVLQKLGIEDEFMNGIDVDNEMEKNNIKSDAAFSVLYHTMEKRLNELGFDKNGKPLDK